MNNYIVNVYNWKWLLFRRSVDDSLSEQVVAKCRLFYSEPNYIKCGIPLAVRAD